MFAAASPSEPGSATSSLRAIRAVGGITLAARRDGAATAIASLHETGGYRVKCPSPRANPLEAVMINTGGGVAGGDCIAFNARAAAGACLSLTTATAERIYRSDGAATTTDITLDVATGATLAWLPQASILFSGSILQRRLAVDVAPTGRLLIVETTAFGRTASGETLARGDIADQWRIRRDSRLVFAEAMRLEGDIAATLARPAVAAGATIAALLLCVTPDAEERRDHVRDSLASQNIFAGVSAWNGLLVARVLGHRLDHVAIALRAAVTALDITPPPAAWTH